MAGSADAGRGCSGEARSELARGLKPGSRRLGDSSPAEREGDKPKGLAAAARRGVCARGVKLRVEVGGGAPRREEDG